ncbi:MotA/TolQ/ExbB proton channel family protein [Brevibacillus sp. H7]|jgi:chemotaxis protein MotA|uniref:MotA/TolQ/ExbB proton channel family protein n=1 Tax=Brevibacillus sp. H7 TaxID=3349138 RepID=UPI0037FF0387
MSNELPKQKPPFAPFIMTFPKIGVGKKMRKDWSTPVGIIIGMILILVSIYFAGGTSGVLGFFSLPSFAIVVGGIFATIFVDFGWKEMKNCLSVIRQTYYRKEVDLQELIEFFVLLLRQSKEKGVILGLEEGKNRIQDAFIRKGIDLVMDGVPSRRIKEILEIEIQALKSRHFRGYTLISKAGEVAPAWGMVGTIIGLVLMLQQLNDPEKLGPGIALALITTFYGVILANLILIPIANKLLRLSEDEILMKTIVTEAVISIRKNESVLVLRQKLEAFITQETINQLKELETRYDDRAKHEAKQGISG